MRCFLWVFVFWVPDVRLAHAACLVRGAVQAVGRGVVEACKRVVKKDIREISKGETGSLGTVTVLQALGVHIPHGQSSTVRANQNWRELQKFNTKKSFADLVNDPNLGRNQSR
jgi:hypothetical protein